MKTIRSFLIPAICTVLLALAASFAVFSSEGLALTAHADEWSNGCKAAYLMDDASGSVIYKKNEDARLPVASMTKIMTMLLAFEAVERGELAYGDMISVSANAASMGGSQVFLDADTAHRADELLKSIAVASANDSCVAIAEHVSGSVGAFVGDMNRRAAELGMNNTNFVNCTGLPAAEHFSSAKDVAIMFRELVKHPKYFEYSRIWTEDYKHPGGRLTNMTNTNKMIRTYSGCDGGKTGFTSEAKFCLAATAKRGNMRLISVAVGADSSKSRFDAVAEMFDNAFASYNCEIMLRAGDAIENGVRVVSGKKDTVMLTAREDLAAFVKRGESGGYEVKLHLPAKVKAAISAGDVIGRAELIRGGEVIGETDILSMEDIGRATLFDEILNIGKHWNKYR